MKISILIKALVISFLSIALGSYFYFDDIRKSALGKDEYLKRQSIRFDRDLLHPHMSIIIATLFLGIILFGLYELICYSIFKIIKRS